MMDEYSSESSLLTWIRTSGIDVIADSMSLMRNSSQMMGMLCFRKFRDDLEGFFSRTWQVELTRTSGIDVIADSMSLMRNSSQSLRMFCSRRFKKCIEVYSSRTHWINPTKTSGIDVDGTKHIDNLSEFQSHFNLIVAGGEA